MERTTNLTPNQVSLNSDYSFGVSQEQFVINKMIKYFGEEIQKTTERYCAYDFTSPTTKYELKSRRISSTAYPTTIIACDKARVEGRLVFLFNFTDGLFYIVFDLEKFAKYEVKKVSAIRSGGLRTAKPHYFINTKDLTKIDI